MLLATHGRRSVVAAAVIVVAAILGGPAATAALAGGGATVAGAADLPLGRQVAGRWDESRQAQNGRYGEFWRVRLDRGDRLIVDWALGRSRCSRVRHGILVYPPSVTDDTVARAKPAVDHGAVGARLRELGWVAPSGGRWTLFFYGCNKTAYTVAAWVQQFTQLRVTAPSQVAHGRAFTVTGRIRGASGGSVAVAVRAPGRAASLPVVASITRRGTFAARMRVQGAGSYTLTASYFGDSTHRASKATAEIHVA